jgi:hypothetical protein
MPTPFGEAADFGPRRLSREAALHSVDMDDERWEQGMPVLSRQPVREPELPPSLRSQRPRSVPETAPTPLQAYYINLSVVGLVAGAIAITALELGAPMASPLVKLCILVAAPPLVATTADATLRIWRSAWAWMPVDRGRGLFRLAWVAAAALLLVTGTAIAVAIVLA